MLDSAALATLFHEARTWNAFRPESVDPALLRKVYETARMGPTAVNANPLRVAFVISKEAKERLRPALSPGNVDKTMGAPVTAIFAHDLAFHEKLDRLIPVLMPGIGQMFAANPDKAEATARQSGTLQAAYFMLAARAYGLDIGPMAGFDNAAVDAAFFAGTTWRSNFLCNLGHGDPKGLYPRNPRLDFEEVAQIL